MFFQIVLTTIGAFLSVVLTKFLIQNGRAIERGFAKMEEGFRKMDERTKEIAEGITKATKEIAALIVQEGKGIKELIKEK